MSEQTMKQLKNYSDDELSREYTAAEANLAKAHNLVEVKQKYLLLILKEIETRHIHELNLGLNYSPKI